MDLAPLLVLDVEEHQEALEVLLVEDGDGHVLVVAGGLLEVVLVFEGGAERDEGKA